MQAVQITDGSEFIEDRPSVKIGELPCIVVYVGDTEIDIATARNTGMDLIMVSWGFRPVSYQKALGAKVIVNSADEIYSLVAEGTVQR